jgi:hypothetical protein
MRPIRWGLATAALALPLAIGVGCGGPSEAEKRAQARERQQQEEYRADLREYREDVRKRDGQQAEYEACMAQLGDLHKALKALDSRLNVGLSYNDYGNEVGDVVVVYDNADFSGLSEECLDKLGIKLEHALRQYQRAFNTWDDCFEDIDCDIDAIEPSLRVHWGRASTQLLGADIGAVQLEPVTNPQKPRKPASEP